MRLKWRIDGVSRIRIDTVYPANARDAGVKFRAIVAAIAALDPVLGPGFIERANAVSFTSPKAPWHYDLMTSLNPEDTRFLDNYVRVDAWWE
jgi:hypothetical protein